MKKTVGLIALVLFLAGSAWILSTWSQEGQPAPTPESYEAAIASDVLEQKALPVQPVELRHEPSEPAAPEASSEREAVPADEDNSPGGPTSHVLGRLEDIDGAPLEGVSVLLSTVGEPWSEDSEQNSYETESDSGGRFEFRTPLPSSSWISLRLVPARFQTLDGRFFGVAGGRNKDPLVEGDNDLGIFTLQTTGAIAGVLRCADGASPEGARVRLDGSFPGGFSLSARVESSGHFVIEHVPAGNYGIEALSKGYLTSKLSSIDVREEQLSDGHELVLERAPFVSGRVLDEHGTPIERVKLWGWPQSSGQGAGARTDKEGLFTVYLPQDESCLFTAEKPGYGVFGKQDGGRGVLYSPGTTGIEIQLVPEVQTTFLVLDATSGTPIERFGLEIHSKPQASWQSSANRRQVPLADHPGGKWLVAADPQKHVVKIQAPGYAPQRIAVQHEAPGVPRQEIRMQREGILRGRVLFDGQAVRQASIRVQRCLFPKPGETRKEVPDIFDETMTYDLDQYLGRLRILTSDESGGFELGELASGTYRVEISAKVGSPYSQQDIAVLETETTDLGDLSLILGATVRGHVVLDGALTVAGLKVHLDNLWQGELSGVDAAGNFEFQGLAPGDHSLAVGLTPGLLIPMEPVPFEARSGESQELTLDLRPWQTGSVRVRILEAGVPRAKLGVSVLSEGGGSRSGREQSNADGELVIECQRGTLAGLFVLSEQGLYLGHATGVLAVTPGAQSLVIVQIETGELTVNFPEGYQLPVNGEAQLHLRHGQDLRGDVMPILLTTDERKPRPTYRAWKTREVPLGPVAAGTYEIVASVWSRPEGEPGRVSPASQRKFTGKLQVQAGTQATCTLVPAADSDK